MRDAKTRLARIGGAVVAIAIVLVVALHLAQGARDTGASHALTAGALGAHTAHTVGATADVVPGPTILE